MDRKDSHHLGQHRQSHPRGTTLTCSPCHTPTLRSPWHSASNRQGQTAKTRFAGERIGAAAATIPPASCTTNLSTIHQITSHPWSYRHTKRTPPQTCTFGDMTMTEHTDSSPWITPRLHTCCYTHRNNPHYGATMSCSLDPRPVSGGTTGSATPWSRSPGSSSCAPPCITLTTMGAPKSPNSIRLPGFRGFQRCTGLSNEAIKTTATSPDTQDTGCQHHHRATTRRAHTLSPTGTENVSGHPHLLEHQPPRPRHGKTNGWQV